MSIDIAQFGKDHWSTFAYIETRCVDHHGSLDKKHMRCDVDRHPAHVYPYMPPEFKTGSKKYPTILRGGVELPDHDDWDCVDDLVAAGLMELRGTGLQPVLALTPKGVSIASLLRSHKSNAGTFTNFSDFLDGRHHD